MNRLPFTRLCEVAMDMTDAIDTARRHLVYGRVRREILNGRLPSPRTQPCADCGQPAAVYDHRDYEKPLEVAAVCLICNQMRGPALGSLAESKDLPR